MRVGIRLGLSRNSCLIDAEILRMPFPLLAISLSGAEEGVPEAERKVKRERRPRDEEEEEEEEVDEEE